MIRYDQMPVRDIILIEKLRLSPLMTHEIADYLWNIRLLDNNPRLFRELIKEASEKFPHLELNTDYEEGVFNAVGLWDAGIDFFSNQVNQRIKNCEN